MHAESSHWFHEISIPKTVRNISFSRGVNTPIINLGYLFPEPSHCFCTHSGDWRTRPIPERN